MAIIIKSNLPQMFSRIRNAPEKAVRATLPLAKKLTPIDSGNARRRTTATKDSIVSDYDYARKILLEGYSKQLEPNKYVPEILEEFRRQMRKFIRR